MLGRLRALVEGQPEFTVEETSAMATVALCADIQSWAVEEAPPNGGYVALEDLIRVLDVLRESATPLLPKEATSG